MAKQNIPKKVKKEISDYLNVLEADGFKIKQAFLFGSFAKGRQKQWSDIDLCIISNDFTKKLGKDPLDYLWQKKIDLKFVTRIEPIGFHPRDFVDESPIVWEIKQHGIRIQ